MAVDILLELVVGVSSNALFSVLNKRGSTKSATEAARAAIRAEAATSPNLLTLLQKASVVAARTAVVTSSDNRRILEEFLVSPDVEAVCRQIFAAEVLPDQGDRLTDIRSEFAESMRLFVGRQRGATSALVNILFDALVATCAEELRIASTLGVAAAQTALAGFHTRLLQSELAAVRKNLSFLISGSTPSIDEYHQFEERYRGQVADRHGYIVPPNVDQADKVPIDALFVNPKLSRIGKATEPSASLARMLRDLDRAVILGQPGGGKSTCAAKLCYDLATRHQDRLCCERAVTPILVVLKDYAAHQQVQSRSVLRYIEQMASAQYQLEPPDGVFGYMLLNGRAMVIFDGLDELLETRDRQTVSADVESFCTAYPSVPVIVTSREVGYSQAPLRSKMFDAFRLAPFDGEQVALYVTKWFAADGSLDDAARAVLVAGFLRESEFVPDLRSNPLMLSLLCRIYRGENYIPQNRPDVYEKCANMLFEQWDRGRGILLPANVQAIAARIRPAIMHLAGWIYADEGLQAGVTEDALVRKMVEYLHKRAFDDEDDARAVASEFVQFLRGRAWVLSDAGTTSSGDSLWAFTHRTFLEFFAAYQLVRRTQTPANLLAELLPRIGRSEWDVVCQLAMQVLNRNAEDGAEIFLAGVIKKSESTQANRRGVFIEFAVRSLGFVVPAPVLTRQITIAALEWMCTAEPKPFKSSEARMARALTSSTMLSELLDVPDQVRPAIEASFVEFAERVFGSGDCEAILAFSDILLHADWVSDAMRIPIMDESVAWWAALVNRLLTVHLAILKTIARDHRWVANELLLLGLAPWADHAKRSKFRGIFARSGGLPLLSQIWVPSLAEHLMMSITDDNYGSLRLTRTSSREVFACVLSDVGRVLGELPPPWVQVGWTRLVPPVHLLRLPPDDEKTLEELFGGLPNVAQFAIVSLYCVLMESEIVPMTALREAFGADVPRNIFSALFLARQSEPHRNYVSQFLEKTSLSQLQKDIIRAWGSAELSFARKAARPATK